MARDTGEVSRWDQHLDFSFFFLLIQYITKLGSLFSSVLKYIYFEEGILHIFNTTHQKCSRNGRKNKLVTFYSGRDLLPIEPSHFSG